MSSSQEISVKQFFDATVARLSSALGTEAAPVARILFEDIAGYDRNYLFINGDRSVTDFMRDKINAAADRVLSGEPVQYVVGSARFMGYDFKVTPAVLIPRPETEGLVDMITDDYSGVSRHLTCLDVGTGSGCIAISLALALKDVSVAAIDISREALEVAQENARRLSAHVDFSQEDALHLSAPATPLYDFIVSNPPYICPREAKNMDSRVLSYEPHGALFVESDADPLLFYRAIATYALKALRDGGRLYFEINADYPQQTVDMLKGLGYADAEALRDYRGLYRYVKACI